MKSKEECGNMHVQRQAEQDLSLLGFGLYCCALNSCVDLASAKPHMVLCLRKQMLRAMTRQE